MCIRDRCKGVFLAPPSVDFIEILGADGRIRFAPDVSLRFHEIKDIIIVTLDRFPIFTDAVTLRKLKVVGNEPLQSFERPQEDALSFGFHLLSKVGIVGSAHGLFLGSQYKLSAVKAVAAVIQGLQITIAECQQPGKHPALITLLALAFQVHFALCSHEDVYKRQGLAGAAISATVNEMAGPLVGNFLFTILAIVLLVFGHGLNMILNVLSVIVHGIRLNTLEFSSHLDMSWSGHKFQPFQE